MFDRARRLDVTQGSAALDIGILHIRRMSRDGECPKPVLIGSRKQGSGEGIILDLAGRASDEKDACG